MATAAAAVMLLTTVTIFALLVVSLSWQATARPKKALQMCQGMAAQWLPIPPQQRKHFFQSNNDSYYHYH